MENEYVTIKEAEQRTGKSDETIRRWIRFARSGYGVDLEDTDQQLEEKEAPLRKRNVTTDKHGVQQFEWLLSTSALLETYAAADSTPPFQERLPLHTEGVNQTNEDQHEEPQPDDGDTREGLQEDLHLNGNHPDEEPQPANRGSQDVVDIDREAYQALIAQLQTKDDQLQRKDDQLDAALERGRETNILLKGYQQRLFALGAPIGEEKVEE